MTLELKIILSINVLGLAISFLVRKFLKKSPLADFAPYVFLYIASLVGVYYLFQSNQGTGQIVKQQIQEKVDEKSRLFDEINSKSALIKEIDAQNEYVRQAIQIDHKKLVLVPKLLKFASVDPFQGSNVVIAVLDANNKPLSWNSYDALTNKIVSDKYRIGISSDYSKYTNKANLTLINDTSDEAKLTLVVYLQASQSLGVNYSRTNAEKPGTKVVAFSDKYWANSIMGDFDSIATLAENSGKNQKLIELRKTFTIKAASSESFKLNILTGPNQISNIDEYKKDLNPSIEKLLYPGGFLVRFLSNVFYKPFVYLFEFFAKFIGPLLAMFLIILIFKLVSGPVHYQGHGFGKEFHKIISVGIATKNQDGIRSAILNNKNLNIRMKVISVIIKLASFMIFWRVFSNSPLFYGAKLLWIQNLAIVDPINLSNLFGLVKTNIPLLPNASFLSLLTILLFYFEIKARNATMPQQEQNQSSILFILIVFLFGISNMSSVFCLYLLFNNVLDHFQNYIFDRFKSKPKTTRKTVAS